MGVIQIYTPNPEDEIELRKRAAARGVSVSDYVWQCIKHTHPDSVMPRVKKPPTDAERLHKAELRSARMRITHALNAVAKAKAALDADPHDMNVLRVRRAEESLSQYQNALAKLEGAGTVPEK
jgi:hypothetical protein